MRGKARHNPKHSFIHSLFFNLSLFLFRFCSASSSSESRKKAPTITSPLPPASPHYNDDDMYVNDGNDSDDDEVDADDKGAYFVAEKFLTNNAPTLLGLAVLGIAGIGIALARKARK